MTIELSYIPRVECKKGFLYKLHARNLDIGVFDGKGFIGIRQKFNDRFLFTEYHWDDGAPYGTAKPLQELQEVSKDIPITECKKHSSGTDWAKDPTTGLVRPVIRRDLKPEEAQHGKRQDFVDEWADTKERLPDNLFPYYQTNECLFKWLNEIKIL